MIRLGFAWLIMLAFFGFILSGVGMILYEGWHNPVFKPLIIIGGISVGVFAFIGALKWAVDEIWG